MIISTTLTGSSADVIGGALASVERLYVRPEVSLADSLAARAPTVQVLLVTATDGSYAKERIVRLPARVRWEGPAHEALRGQRTAESETLDGLRFSELPKDEAALRHKFERDVIALRAYTRKRPKEPRWHYYLGASHHDLGQYAAALEAKRYEDAIAWSNMAIVNGFNDGAGASFARIGFRDPSALHEGPYEVLRATFEALGNAEAAEAARQERDAAQLVRMPAARSGGGD